MLFPDHLILLRGAGDLATGVALRLRRCGFPIVLLELPRPLVVRRTVAFAEAVRTGRVVVEGVEGRRVADAAEAAATASAGTVALLVDPAGESLAALAPTVVVDARLAKRNLDSRRSDAPLVIGLGPGFEAGEDVDAVVETMRGHDLGRVIWRGPAAPDTGTPGRVAGRQHERVLRAPAAGRVVPRQQIGDLVQEGAIIAHLQPPTGPPLAVTAPFTGRLRGLIAPDVEVPAALKIGDLDPRVGTRVDRVSDKSLAIGGGVLEAVLMWLGGASPAEGGRE